MGKIASKLGNAKEKIKMAINKSVETVNSIVDRMVGTKDARFKTGLALIGIGLGLGTALIVYAKSPTIVG